jgi:hypothetical protein
MKRSKRSFFALQIGQISGGLSRAHKYPQTLQRQTGAESDEILNSDFIVCFFLSFFSGRRSGIGDIFCFPSITF